MASHSEHLDYEGTDVLPTTVGRSEFNGHQMSRSEIWRFVFDAAPSEHIRACAIDDVMRKMCSVMASNDIGGAWWATEEAYETLSAPVEELDGFLSHTWGSSRRTKFLQLAFIFNLRAALGVSICVAVAFSVPMWLDVAPRFESLSGQTGVAGYIAGTAAYYVVLLLKMEIACHVKPFNRFVPLVFLDKLCVNQVDDRKKQLGISALAAAIKRSKRMIILHSGQYLSRLWTNFELACFVAVHQTKSIEWMPSYLPPVVLITSAFITCTSLIHRVLSSPDISGPRTIFINELIFSVFVLAAAVVLFVTFRWMAAERYAMDRSIAEFDIRCAQCTDERDRETVTNLIAHFEDPTDSDDPATWKERSLDSFNRRIREDVRLAILRSLGRNGISYKHACAAMWTEILWVPEESAAMWLDEQPWGAIAAKACLVLARVFFVWPLTVALMFWMASRCQWLRKSRGREIIYSIACSPMPAGFMFICTRGLRRLAPSNLTGAMGPAPFITAMVCLMLATILVYRRRSTQFSSGPRQS